VIARKGDAALAATAAALFFLTRIPLLFVREPFFDELWTVWLARKPFGEIVPALLLDSGPPLYYFLARIPNVFALRCLSLVFATATLVLLLKKRWLVAALLLAVFPPAVLYAVDARAYALCGLFVAIGVVALREKPIAGAFSLLLAAYTHWYGALFLPLVVLAKSRRALVVPLLFLPGLWLASKQPAVATAWMGERPAFDALGAIFFVRTYVDGLFASPPLVLCVIAFVATAMAFARDWRFAPFVLVPVLLAFAFGLAERTVYFPMRFESVLAVPFVVWIAASLEKWPRLVRLALLATLVTCGAIAVAIGTLEHQRRPLTAHREAAIALRLFAGERVLASGYLYLEAASQIERVEAYPSEQGKHPGWARFEPANEPLPPETFVWIADPGDPRLRMLGSREVQVLFENEAAVILRVRAAFRG
jgi:hypothetical protein